MNRPSPPRRTSLPLSLAGCAATLLAGCATRPHAPALSNPGYESARLAQAMRLYEQADAAKSQRQWTKAESLYRQALAAQDDIGGAWNNLGMVLTEQGNALDAAMAFRRAAELLPADPRPVENLAIAYQNSGHFDEALQYFGEALERDPNRLTSLRGAIRVAKDLNRVDQVTLDRLNRALLIETDPTWRRIMEYQKMRVEQDLSDLARNSPRAS